MDSVRTVSGQCPDSVRTVSGQCLQGVWKVFETEVFVNTFFAKLSPSGQCPDSVWTVSERYWIHPQEKLKQTLEISQTMSRQCLDSV